MRGETQVSSSEASSEAWRHVAVLCAAGLLACVMAGCSPERRDVDPSPPVTPPSGATDGRQTLYETNLLHQAEGGRMFRWAGCGACHSETSAGAAYLADNRWAHGSATAQIYETIAKGASGMPAYEGKLTPLQIWQIAGYVKTLHKAKPEVRRRNDAAQQGEPSGAAWKGALR